MKEIPIWFPGAVDGVGRAEVAANGRNGDSGRGLADMANRSKGFVLLAEGGDTSGEVGMDIGSG